MVVAGAGGAEGIQFLFGTIRKFWKWDSVDGCTTVPMYLMPLKCTQKWLAWFSVMYFTEGEGWERGIERERERKVR